jgi:ABC-type uncharacterized transport system involved in gliding motility auxiliary subunit
VSNYFENQLRSYPVVLAALQAFSKDICRNCIGLEGAQVKVEKGLKKLRIDLEAALVPQEEKIKLLARIESLAQEAEEIDVSEDCECQKTAGNCKIGPGCFPLGAGDIMKLITEPAAP